MMQHNPFLPFYLFIYFFLLRFLFLCCFVHFLFRIRIFFLIVILDLYIYKCLNMSQKKERGTETPQLNKTVPLTRQTCVSKSLAKWLVLLKCYLSLLYSILFFALDCFAWKEVVQPCLGHSGHWIFVDISFYCMRLIQNIYLIKKQEQ